MPVSFYVVFDRPSGNQTSFSKHEATPTYRLSRPLVVIWTLLYLLLLGAGVTFVALSLIWMDPDPLNELVFGPIDLITGLALGAVLIASFLVMLPALVQTLALKPKQKFRQTPMLFLNSVLLIDMMCIIGSGGIVWSRTLQERETFFKFWESVDSTVQAMLQAKFNCCGYFDACPATDLSPALPVCVDPISNYADRILNALFTSMFAMSAVIASLILCTSCVIAELKVLERYRRIDIKRGRLSAA